MFIRDIFMFSFLHLALGVCFSDMLAEYLPGEWRGHLGYIYVRGGAGKPLLEPKVPGM